MTHLNIAHITITITLTIEEAFMIQNEYKMLILNNPGKGTKSSNELPSKN